MKRRQFLQSIATLAAVTVLPVVPKETRIFWATKKWEPLPIPELPDPKAPKIAKYILVLNNKTYLIYG